jgi:hypothetical protein
MFLQMFSQLRLRGRCALRSMVVGAGIRDVPVLNAHVAHAMIDSLHQQHARFAE